MGMSCMYGLVGPFLCILRVIRFYLLTFLILLCLSLANAENFTEDVNVFEEDGVYHINISSEIDASEQYVRNVVTDYVHIYRLSDSIIESKVLKAASNGTTEVQTLVLCCVPVFCREVTRVEEVRELETGEIQTVIIPEKSDFLSGSAIWKLEPVGFSTRLTYEATLEPDFLIPPLLGTQMIIDNMRKEYSTTIFRIQHIARINEEKEWDDDFEFKRVIAHQQDEPCNTDQTSSFQ